VLDQVQLLVGLTRVARPALRRFHGRIWPLALARGVLRARSLVRATHWADRRDGEARHVRALALLPALCLDARERGGEAARSFVHDLAQAFVEAENGRIAQEAGLPGISDPRQRWHAFIERAVAQGIGAFNENEFLSVEADRYHLRIVRCVLAELASETGVPELARTTCDLSAAFHSRLLPSHEFSRGGSMRNTLAYGHPCCEYVWQRRDPAAMADVGVELSGDQTAAVGL
jgi:hypothetical protein